MSLRTLPQLIFVCFLWFCKQDFLSEGSDTLVYIPSELLVSLPLAATARGLAPVCERAFSGAGVGFRNPYSCFLLLLCLGGSVTCKTFLSFTCFYYVCISCNFYFEKVDCCVLEQIVDTYSSVVILAISIIKSLLFLSNALVGQNSPLTGISAMALALFVFYILPGKYLSILLFFKLSYFFCFKCVFVLLDSLKILVINV